MDAPSRRASRSAWPRWSSAPNSADMRAGVRRAAGVLEQQGVEQIRPRLTIELELVGQAHADKARPFRVSRGLPLGDVERARQGANQLGQRDPSIVSHRRQGIQSSDAMYAGHRLCGRACARSPLCVPADQHQITQPCPAVVDATWSLETSSELVSDLTLACRARRRGGSRPSPWATMGWWTQSGSVRLRSGSAGL